MEQCRFTIDTPLCDGQRFAVTGPCTGRIRALPVEKRWPCRVLGGGHRREQVLHQRDYYDAGEMIYEHLPAGLGGTRREAEVRS